MADRQPVVAHQTTVTGYPDRRTLLLIDRAERRTATFRNVIPALLRRRESRW